MSTYSQSTKHPDTGEWDDHAVWMDDYFGHHNYGVKFSDGSIFDPRDTEMELRNVPIVSVSLEDPEITVEDAGAHTATVTKHPDGRQDVRIDVTRLDITEDDELSMKAKKTIEEGVLPRIQEAKVQVVVIHRHSTASTSKMVSLSRVREYAEFAVTQFQEGMPEAQKQDFIVVEVHEGSYLTRVSTLVNV